MQRWMLPFASALMLGCAPTLAEQPPPSAAKTGPVPAPRYASPFTYEWFIRAELSRGRGQLAAAVEAYREALAGADEDAEIEARLATALDELGDHVAARRVIDEALAREPGSLAAQMARAEIAARAGDDALVFEALERAEQADPLSARGPLALASYLRAHGAPERADAVLLRYEARALAGTREAQLVHLRRALASGDVERIFEATSPYRMGAPPEAAELSEAARVLLEQQRSAQALRVIELVPETPNETGLRLRVFVACARFATAEAWLASHEPEGIEARAAAVRVYLALGQLGRANDLLEATKLDRSASERPGVLQLLAAKIALARGDVSEAALSFARAAAFQGTRAEALRGLAEALRGAALPELASELPAQ